MKHIVYIFLVLVLSCCKQEKTHIEKTNKDINREVSVNNESHHEIKPQKDLNSPLDKRDSLAPKYEKEYKFLEQARKRSDITPSLEQKIRSNLRKARIANRNYYPESIVVGHLEEDTIIGCFDGLNIDTLFIKSRPCGCKNSSSCKHAETYETIKYYLVSKSGRFPMVRLLAADHLPPRIVNEGDLDGNGTCEIGYMYTWVTSNWRSYRILTWHDNQWRYLINPNKDYMVSRRDFRLSGYEVAEAGKDSGTVIIHTGFSYPAEGLRTRIVKPTFSTINDI